MRGFAHAHEDDALDRSPGPRQDQLGENFGAAELATAILIVAVVAARLHTLTDTTEKVLDGTVYIVVLAVVVMFAVPNLPVGILCSFYVKK